MNGTDVLVLSNHNRTAEEAERLTKDIKAQMPLTTILFFSEYVEISK